MNTDDLTNKIAALTKSVSGPTFLYNGNECFRTGRVAKRKQTSALVKGVVDVTMIEVEMISSDSKLWIRPEELFTIE